MEWTKEDEINLERLLSVSNDITGEWLQKKAEEMRTLMVYYRCAIMEIETKLKVLNQEFSLKHDRNPISNIKTRLKSYGSIKEKMERRGIVPSPTNIENSINDIAGVRVICTFPDDVYAVAEALLKQDDITLIERKDYIQNPKPNGYRSLHLIIKVPIFLQHEKHLVKVEIQLRTIAMDFWASLEHEMRYKKNFEFTDAMAEELLECATLSATLDERMEKLNKCLDRNDGEQK